MSLKKYIFWEMLNVKNFLNRILANGWLIWLKMLPYYLYYNVTIVTGGMFLVVVVWTSVPTRNCTSEPPLDYSTRQPLGS